MSTDNEKKDFVSHSGQSGTMDGGPVAQTSAPRNVGPSYHDIDKLCTVCAFATFVLLPGVVEPIYECIKHFCKDTFLLNLLHASYYQLGAFLVILFIVAKRHPDAPMSDVLCIHRSRWAKVGTFLHCLVLLVVSVAVANYITTFFQEALSIKLPAQEIFLQTLECSWSVFFVLVIPVVVFAPILEEIMFRRFLHGWLSQHMPWFPATLVTSVIFSAMHLNLLQALPLFSLAMCLQYAFRKTNSLLEPIILHMLVNGNTIFLVLLCRLGSLRLEDVGLEGGFLGWLFR